MTQTGQQCFSKCICRSNIVSLSFKKWASLSLLRYRCSLPEGIVGSMGKRESGLQPKSSQQVWCHHRKTWQLRLA